MNSNPHLLVIEEEPAVFNRIEAVLAQANLPHSATRVEPDTNLFVELRIHPPDVIVADENQSQADSTTLAHLVRHRCPNTPFILLTGELEPDQLADRLAWGADEWVVKNHLRDLVPAIQRAVKKSGPKQHKVRTLERERDQLRQGLRAFVLGNDHPISEVSVCRACHRADDGHGNWVNPTGQILGLRGLTIRHELCPDCIHLYYTSTLPLEEAMARSR